MKTIVLTPMKFMDRFESSGWMHIAPFGSWKGHPAGEFAFTRDSAGDVIAKFSEQKNPIPLDYEHQSMSAQKHAGPVPGAGFITELRVDDDGLFGMASLTELATEKVRSGEYAFCSPVFVFDAPDRVTGDPVKIELISVALTNNPFLDGQQPLTFTRENMKESIKVDETKTVDLAAKGKADDADNKGEPEEKVVKSADPPAEGDSVTADAAAAVDLLAKQAGISAAELIAKLMAKADDVIKALGESDAATGGGSSDMEEGAELSRKIEDMKVMLSAAENRAGEFAGRIKELEEQVAVFTSIAAEKKKADDDAKREADEVAKAVKLNSHIDGLIAEGYARKEARPDMIAVFSRDWDQGERLFHRTKVLPLGPSQSGPTKNDNVLLSQSERHAVDALCSRGGAYQGDKLGAIKAVLNSR